MGRRKCVACGNLLQEGKGTFFSIPPNEKYRKKWLEALNITQVRPGNKVCIKHFKPTDFAKGHGTIKRLRANAVPCLNPQLDVLSVVSTENESLTVIDVPSDTSR